MHPSWRPQNFQELVPGDGVGLAMMNFRNWFAVASMLLLSPPGLAQDAPRSGSANNDFAFEVLRRLGSGNQIFSPHSVRTAFALCLAGTDGATNQEMGQVLGLDGAKAQADLLKIQAALDAVSDGEIELRTANRIWGDNRSGYIEQAFLDFVRQQYGAELGRVDFREYDAARASINRWVSEQTNDKIPELLPKGSVTPRTVMVMTNAIYFLGKWEHQFDKECTRKMPFHLNAKDDVQVPFMHRSGQYQVATTQGCTAVALPYQGGQLRMVIMIPDGDLAGFRKEMTGVKYAKLRAALQYEELDLAMPRFKLQKDCSLHSEILPAMGMKAPFEYSHDWTPLNGDKHRLCISGVFHSAMIDVDEAGTEAAAATAIAVGREMAVISRGLSIDRPFAFTIEHTKSGHILFAGDVANPK